MGGGAEGIPGCFVGFRSEGSGNITCRSEFSIHFSRDAERNKSGDYVRLFRSKYIPLAHANDLSASIGLSCYTLQCSPMSLPCHANTEPLD